MLRIGLRVTINGATHEVTAGPLELVMFEREYGVSAASLASQEPRLEWMCFLAYRAMRRAGLFDASFDDFLAAVEMVEGSGGDPRPTDAAAST